MDFTSTFAKKDTAMVRLSDFYGSSYANNKIMYEIYVFRIGLVVGIVCSNGKLWLR